MMPRESSSPSFMGVLSRAITQSWETKAQAVKWDITISTPLVTITSPTLRRGVSETELGASGSETATSCASSTDQETFGLRGPDRRKTKRLGYLGEEDKRHEKPPVLSCLRENQRPNPSNSSDRRTLAPLGKELKISPPERSKSWKICET